MKINALNVFSALTIVTLITSCSESNFSGKNRSNKLEREKIEETYHLSCNEDYGKVFPITAGPTDDVYVRLKGEICPQKTNDLTVLFVVDFSGSMGYHTPSGKTDKVKGNDPKIDDSCGRLKAAKAIVEKLTNEKDYGDQVRVGMIPFAGGVLQNRVINLQELDFFSEDLNSDKFCSYVVQSGEYGYNPQNPGGIDGSGITSATNYEAAFNTAQQMLVNVSDRKVVYFISDGQPTEGSGSPIEAGVTAGQRLNDLEDLTLNALVLGKNEKIAIDVMTRITGDKKQVRSVWNAKDLAHEIVKFPSADLHIPTARAYTTILDIDKRLNLHKFEKVSDGRWAYETAYFKLRAGKGETHDHNIRVTVDSDESVTIETAVTVSFSRNYE
jgi:hypothetical protein